LEVLRRQCSQFLDRIDPGLVQFLKERGRQAWNNVERSGCRLLHLLDLALDLCPLFFLALDIDAPANQLGSKAYILAFLADRKGQLGVLNNHLHDLVSAVDHSDSADLSRADRVRSEGYGVVIPLDDVDLFAAKFANDRLHTGTLHTHASAD